MPTSKTRNEARDFRHRRIRKRVQGTPERPRLAVFRSNQHIYAQVIDDAAGHTLAFASTLDPDLRGQNGNAAGKQDAAKAVGASVARKAKDAGVAQVVLDRGGFAYHGRVKALADAAREEGLNF